MSGLWREWKALGKAHVLASHQLLSIGYISLSESRIPASPTHMTDQNRDGMTAPLFPRYMHTPGRDMSTFFMPVTVRPS